MNFTEPVIAALIGAGATVVTALVQLRLAGKRQAAEKAAGRPIAAKSNSWLAILALMLAAAVGGYALSEYQSYQERQDNKVLRDEMYSRMRELSGAALRLERAGTERNGQSEADARAAAERQRGAEGVAAVINVPACRGAQVGFSQSPASCAESDALRAALCVSIPAAAVVTEVQMFSRAEDSQQPWAEVRMQQGQDAGGAKFVDAFFERALPEAKEVCQHFMHWNSQKGRSARILVKYVP